MACTKALARLARDGAVDRSQLAILAGLPVVTGSAEATALPAVAWSKTLMGGLVMAKSLAAGVALLALVWGVVWILGDGF